MPTPLKTARLTVLIAPAVKKAFEEACRGQDMTPSQVVRRLIREFMDKQPAQRAAPRKAAPSRRSR